MRNSASTLRSSSAMRGSRGGLPLLDFGGVCGFTLALDVDGQVVQGL